MVRRLAVQQWAKVSANIELDDLYQVGMIGLFEALAEFVDNGRAQFETYATTRIRGAMLDELRRCDHLTRLQRKTATQVAKAEQSLGHSLGRKPRLFEVSCHLGIDPSEMYLSGSVPLEDHDMLDEALTPEERFQRVQQCDLIIDAIARLTSREQWVLTMHYVDDIASRDIATLLGVTESRVSQLIKDATDHLREQIHGY
jgi:RNA polymerase sigma factor for flagellar operon FliA